MKKELEICETKIRDLDKTNEDLKRLHEADDKEKAVMRNRIDILTNKETKLKVVFRFR